MKVKKEILVIGNDCAGLFNSKNSNLEEVIAKCTAVSTGPVYDLFGKLWFKFYVYQGNLTEL